MSKSTFIIGHLQTACAVECPLPGIRVAGGEDSFDNSDNVVVRQQSPVAGILRVHDVISCHEEIVVGKDMKGIRRPSPFIFKNG